MHESNLRTSAASKVAAWFLVVPASVEWSGSTLYRKSPIVNGRVSLLALSSVRKSSRSVSMDGIFAYRSTVYPASMSMESRLASSLSLPLWLASSSSMVASTLNALLITTKSAIFCEKRLRLAPSFAVSIAPNATCVNTVNSGDGNASNSLQNIFCSCAVAIGFAWNRPVLALVVLGNLIATIASAVKANKIITVVVVFIGRPFLRAQS